MNLELWGFFLYWHWHIRKLLIFTYNLITDTLIKYFSGSPRSTGSQSRCQPGLQASQDCISRCPLSTTFMKLLVRFTGSHNIIQRIPSVPWHRASWWGSWVLTMWVIKNTRDRHQENSQIIVLCSLLLPNIFSSFSLQVSLYVHLTLSGRETHRGRKTRSLDPWEDLR